MNADKATASPAQDDAFDLQTRVAEVQQQAEMQARGAKVVDALGAMDVGHRLGGLQLDDHRFLDQQIHRIVTDDDPIIRYGDAALLRDLEAGLTKLMRERIFVHLLNKSSPKCIGDGHSTADDSLRQIVRHSVIGVHRRSSVAKNALLPSHQHIAEKLTDTAACSRASAASRMTESQGLCRQPDRRSGSPRHVRGPDRDPQQPDPQGDAVTAGGPLIEVEPAALADRPIPEHQSSPGRPRKWHRGCPSGRFWLRPTATLVHPAGIADAIPMVRIGRFQLSPGNRPRRVKSSGGMY